MTLWTHFVSLPLMLGATFTLAAVGCRSSGGGSASDSGGATAPSTAGDPSTAGGPSTGSPPPATTAPTETVDPDETADSADSDDTATTGGDRPAFEGVVDVPECADLDGIGDHCGWHYRFDARACDSGGCTKMVAFFAGGDQACENYGDILDGFASAGYLATCITIFESNKGTAAEPFLDEAPRVDAVLANIRNSAAAASFWTGEHLLISGISHGATAPVIAMARTDLDDASHWHGETTTGACFLDGIYDIPALDDLLGTGARGGGQCILPVPHARMIGRYYDSAPLTHDCANSKCACAKGHSSAMESDSISEVPPAEFAIRNWMLVECGSSLPACVGDIVPGPPIEALCGGIDAGAQHNCGFISLPDVSHVQCAGPGSLGCIEWFDVAAG